MFSNKIKLYKGGCIMDIVVAASPNSISWIMSIITLAIFGVGIYLLFLIIKALRIYIRKNS